jgi:hypothetical protein
MYMFTFPIFTGNLKNAHGKYTPVQVERCCHLSGNVGRDLDRTFAGNIAETTTRSSHGHRKTDDAVLSFVQEYLEDNLFASVAGRSHRHFPDFNAKRLHKTIKKPAQLKSRLQTYANKLDRGRYAAYVGH